MPSKQTVELVSRIALFIVLFWFGALKLTGESPANQLVEELLGQTLSFVPFEQFVIFLGVFEMVLGVSFLIPKISKLSLILLLIHMSTTFLPLFLLPALGWQAFLTPTLEGQYIIKNIVIIALALNVASRKI